MKTNKSVYELGESVYCAETGKFLGSFVNELTDYINGETFEFCQKQKKFGPISDSHNVGSQKYKCYSSRKVFSFRFGTVKQILTENGIDGELVWINV